MKDLSTDNKESILLGKVKSFLNISWEDTDTDTRLSDFIVSSINRLDDIAGVELDYVDDVSNANSTYQKMCYLARELLLNRVFYMNEKGLDDFEDNYRSEVTSLYLLGTYYKREY